MIALTTTAIAWLLLVIVTAGFIVYAALNLRSSRDELGSEIELAPNREKIASTAEGSSASRFKTN